MERWKKYVWFFALAKKQSSVGITATHAKCVFANEFFFHSSPDFGPWSQNFPSASWISLPRESKGQKLNICGIDSWFKSLLCLHVLQYILYCIAKVVNQKCVPPICRCRTKLFTILHTIFLVLTLSCSFRLRLSLFLLLLVTVTSIGRSLSKEIVVLLAIISGDNF